MFKIESTSNGIFKETKKLLTRNGRKKSDLFIIEGERIVCDAVKNGADVKYILISGDYSGKTDFFGNINVYSLSGKLFDELKSTVNSQGILAVAGYTNKELSQLGYSDGVYLYLDSVTDPGNMGTIIRSANAFNVKGILISKGCVDVFNPKVLRSTMSGIFSANLYFDEGNVLLNFREKGFKIIGTFPDGASPAKDFSYGNKSVIVMGNEANGICPEVENLCTHRVTIPMTGNAESLNVSVACGIMLYEASLNSSK